MRALVNAAATLCFLLASLILCLERLGPLEPAAPRAEMVALVGRTGGPATATSESEAAPAPVTTPVAAPIEVSARLQRLHLARGKADFALMMDFSATVNFQTEYEVRGNRLAILVSPVALEGLATQARELEAEFGPVEVVTGSPLMQKLTLTLPEGVSPSAQTRGSSGQGRTLLFDFDVSGADLSAEVPAAVSAGSLTGGSKKLLGRGLNFYQYRWAPRDGAGSNVYVHRLDLAQGNFELKLALAKERLHARQPLSQIAQRQNAAAAINAGYFSIGGNGDPLGLLVDAGQLLAAPVYARSAIGLFPGGRVLFGNPELSGRIVTKRGSVPLDGLNQARQPGKLVLYTPQYGASTRTSGEGLEAAIAGGRVLAVGNCDLPIPPGGFVVSCQGTLPPLLNSLGAGDEVSFQYGLTPPWNSSLVAVGGGPRLVREGAVVTNYESERFSREFAMERAPRTGVGLTSTGKLLLVAVDGRKRGVNAGVTLPEFGAIFLSLGSVDALNMDGGGSTTSWLAGSVVNRPSDGRERPITSALVVVGREPNRVAAASWTGDLASRL